MAGGSRLHLRGYRQLALLLAVATLSSSQDSAIHFRANGGGCRFNGNTYETGTLMEYNCPQGYDISTLTTTRTCTSTGQWNPADEPFCSRSNQDDNGYPSKCPSDWGAWKCTADCGKSGLKVRYRGIVYDVHSTSQGKNRLYAQCDINTEIESCERECATGIIPRVNGYNGPTEGIVPRANTGAAETTSTPSPAAEQQTTESAPVTTTETEPEESIVPANPGEEYAATTSTTMTNDGEEVGTAGGNPNQGVSIPLEDGNGIDEDVHATSQPTTATTAQHTESAEQGRGCSNNEEPGPDEPRCEFQGKFFRPGARLQYECLDGFRRKGRHYRKCKKKGTGWSGLAPKCVNNEIGSEICPGEGWWGLCDKECEDEIGYGSRHRHIYKQVLESHCISNNTYIVRCKRYNESEICRGNRLCTPQPCLPIVKRPHSTLKIVRNIPMRGGFANGSEVLIECDRNYEADGFQHLVCQSGVWSDPVPNCLPAVSRSCQPPAVPTGGKCLPRQDLHPVGEMVTCSCTLAGHGNAGTAVRFCKENLKWSGKVTTCTRGHTSCPDPGIPANGRRYGLSFRPGNVVTFKCNPGYTFPDRAQTALRCLNNGSWNGKLPRCEYNFESVPSLVSRLQHRGCSGFGQSCPCLPERSCTNCHNSRSRSHFSFSLQNANQPCCGFCSSCCLELVFVFDESTSISVRNFRASIRFAKEVVQAQLNRQLPGQGCLRVAGVTYSHESARLSGLTDAEQMLRDPTSWLTSGPVPRGGPTGTRCGLREARHILKKARPSCRKIVFLMTDGNSNWCGPPTGEASRLRCAGCTELFVVGVGTDLDIGMLSKIASHPTRQHLFVLQRFGDLHKLGAAFLNHVVHL